MIQDAAAAAEALAFRVLNLALRPNDADATTIRGYLTSLLRQVWLSKEGFSGKRPFGESAWEYALYEALIEAGLVEGERDDYGYIDQFDRAAADKLILAAINALTVPERCPLGCCKRPASPSAAASSSGRMYP